MEEEEIGKKRGRQRENMIHKKIGKLQKARRPALGNAGVILCGAAVVAPPHPAPQMVITHTNQ